MTEYGLVFFDVPLDERNLYGKIRRFINKTCLPVNQSVYIFDWGLKEEVEKKLHAINISSRADINIVKFDKASTSELESIALKQLEKIYSEINGRLQSTIAKISDNTKKEAALDRVASRLKQIESLLVVYNFAKRTESTLDKLKEIVGKEYKAVRGY